MQRLRDQFGRFISNLIPNSPKPIEVESEKSNTSNVSTVETEDTPIIETLISTEISINGNPIDLTNLQKDDAVVLWNFGILNTEHFKEICRLEGWIFTEEIEYEDEYED